MEGKGEGMEEERYITQQRGGVLGVLPVDGNLSPSQHPLPGRRNKQIRKASIVTHNCGVID